jgi:hypothetical protein
VTRSIVAALAMAVALGLGLGSWSQAQSAAPAPSSTGALTGEAIYLRAVHAMRKLSAPPYVTFREDVAARNLTLSCGSDGLDIKLRHGDTAAAFRVWYRSRDNESVAWSIPAGKRFDDGAFLQPVSSPKDSDDLFGDKPTPTPAPDQDLNVGSGAPPIIAAVRAESAHFYQITLVDEEPFDGHTVYRLAMRAYRNSDDRPLTSMLVDADSWLVRQATGAVSGHYVVASGYAGGTITFAESGPWWVVRDEHLELAANALLVHTHLTVDVHASEFTFPSALPDVFPTPRPKKTG